MFNICVTVQFKSRVN